MSSTRVLKLKSTIVLMPHRAQNQAVREILRKNLRYLMDHEQWTERDLEKRAKVSQKGINKILNKTSAATIETLDKVASAFGLHGWQLLIDNLPDTLKEESNTSSNTEKIKQRS